MYQLLHDIVNFAVTLGLFTVIAGLVAPIVYGSWLVQERNNFKK